MKETLDQESRESLAVYRIEKCDIALKEAELLAANHMYDSAVTRLYYACFYISSALLIKNKIETGSHKGVKIMLSLKFVQTGKLDRKYIQIFTNLLNGRQLSDYEDFVYQTKDSYDVYRKEALDFVNEIKKLLEESDSSSTS